ncbi:uncharacterized protein LOC119488226 [Sebastes umbrosus]|uniref:uncharacterized protein LOC119488226 n=1 Tax=Sebastes umbrosus TaxID=72105 RepID=UPI00189D6B96|nr:uncharacterized protein LOC119488226 [Sebastes umbrosus]
MLRRSSRLDIAGYYNLQGEPVISYRETSTYRRPKRFAHDSRKDTTKKMVRFVPEAKEASGVRGANEASRNSINRWLFYMLFVCLGIVNFTLALSMNSNSLDTVLSRTEGLEQQVRMLQNEVLRLKRINELPPSDSMPNFALESQGARLLAHLSSKTYQSAKPTFSIPIWNFSIPFWRPTADPSIVTQGGPIVVGRCWPFHGHED